MFFAAVPPAAVRAQSPSALLKPQAQQSGKVVTLDVVVDGAHDLGAFQMVVTWDPAILSLTDVKETNFLAGSGRKPYCPAPNTQVGAFRLDCVTFNVAGRAPGAVQAPGVDGSGALVRAHLKVLKAGRTNVHLSRVLITDPNGTALPSKTADLDLRVSGGGGFPIGMTLMIGLPALGVLAVLAAGAFLVLRARRGRAPALQQDPAMSFAEEEPGRHA